MQPQQKGYWGLAFLSCFAFVYSVSVVTARAQSSQPPAPAYDPTAGAVLNGLKGIVTGTKTSLETYRAIARMTQFRSALAKAIFASDNPAAVSISGGNILCSVRENYAQVAVDAAYISSITGALDKAPTPVTISTLGEAIFSFFNNYSVDVKGNVGQFKPGATRDACISDLKTWAESYYNHKFGRPKPIEAAAAATPVTTGIDGFLADAGAISGLASAVVAIVTPIAAYAANKYQTDQRNGAIDSFLTDPKQKALMSTAADLATAATALARQSRYQALGQFAEKLAALHQIKVDLTKLSAGNNKTCADVVKTSAVESEKFGLATNAATPAGAPTLHFQVVPAWIGPGMEIYAADSPEGVPTGTTVKSMNPTTVTMSADAGGNGIAKGAVMQFTFYTSGDEFTLCFAQAWKQISSTAADVVAAATAYDTVADVPDEQLTSAVKSIQKDLAKPLPWPTSNAPASAQAAAQLVAFGQTMSTAFSSANLQKVQTELDLVKSQFGIK